MIDIIVVKECNVLSSNVQQAENGMMAYNMATQNHFDLILMDINMPILDGLTSCKLIKKLYQNKT